VTLLRSPSQAAFRPVHNTTFYKCTLDTAVHTIPPFKVLHD
jgi:hypothetical protein